MLGVTGESLATDGAVSCEPSAGKRLDAAVPGSCTRACGCSGWSDNWRIQWHQNKKNGAQRDAAKPTRMKRVTFK